jgi:hypothetical protein
MKLSDEQLTQLETELAQDATLPDAVKAAIMARARGLAVRSLHVPHPADLHQ